MINNTYIVAKAHTDRRLVTVQYLVDNTFTYTELYAIANWRKNAKRPEPEIEPVKQLKSYADYRGEKA